MKEKILTNKKHGIPVFIILFIVYIIDIVLMINSIANDRLIIAILAAVYVVVGLFLFFGLRILRPQEAVVLTLFGKYYGTLKGEGFYYVNPLCVAFNPASNTKLGQSGDMDVNGKFKLKSGENDSDTGSGKKISLKIMTLSNSVQKINDALGNPVEIGIAVMWKVDDTAKAVFNVDNFKEYLSLQCDAALRDVVRQYPYDVAPNIDTTGDGNADDGSLRGSSDVVTERIKKDIQERVGEAGIIIIEARITYLAYAPEIAAVMLKRQQASAIVDARAMIVDGAVGMVKGALEKLGEEGIVDLDEERKAAMVSNLMVVLCGNHDAQPVVNSGSLY